MTENSETSNSSPQKLTDWEQNWKDDTVGSLFDTIKGVLLSPSSYFEGMGAVQNALPMLVYIYILSFVGSITGVIIQTAYEVMQGKIESLVVIPIVAAVLIFAPLGAMAGSFIGGGLMHLGVIYIGGSKKTYMHTMQVVGYCSATALWGIIPFVGPWIQAVHQIILSVIGLKKIHNISWSSAILSGLIPTFLFCCCFGSVMMFIGGMFAAITQLPQ